MQFYLGFCYGGKFLNIKDVFNKVGRFDEGVVFAENHDFARRAKKYGFIILPREMHTSVRRMDREGGLNFVMKYVYAGLYRLIRTEITKEIFKYDNKR